MVGQGGSRGGSSVGCGVLWRDICGVVGMVVLFDGYVVMVEGCMVVARVPVYVGV